MKKFPLAIYIYISFSFSRFPFADRAKRLLVRAVLRFLDEKRGTGILEFSGGDTIETISGSPPGRIFHLAEISKEKRKDVLSSGGKKEGKEHRETIKRDDRSIDRSIESAGLDLLTKGI